MESYFLVGEVLKPQGIRGEAKVRPYASNPDDYFRWSTMYLEKDGQYRPIGVKCSRVHDGFAYMTLEGCTGPEDAAHSCMWHGKTLRRWRKAKSISGI